MFVALADWRDPISPVVSQIFQGEAATLGVTAGHYRLGQLTLIERPTLTLRNQRQ